MPSEQSVLDILMRIYVWINVTRSGSLRIAATFTGKKLSSFVEQMLT